MTKDGLAGILASPDDLSPIDLKAVPIERGVLDLRPARRKPRMASIYDHEQFQRWSRIIEDRIEYYTTRSTVAGRVANWSYKSIGRFNVREGWVVDIGCGDGSQLALLDDRSRYVGIDTNVKRLIILKQRYPEATAILADACLLPLRTGAIRNIFSSNAFEHIWRLKDAIAELYRCASDDGRLNIVIPTEGGLWNVGRALLSRPRFKRKYPDIDFDFISHIEHCNNAKHIVRNLETFFEVKKRYLPTRIPSVYCNILVDLECSPLPGRLPKTDAGFAV